MMRQLIVTIGLLLTILWFAEMASAAQISKARGASIMIDMQGDTLLPGQTFFALDPQGKKKAIVQITKVKGNRGLGKLLKGQAAAGFGLVPRDPTAAPRQGTRRASTRPAGGLKRAYWGGLVGYAMDSMSVDVQSALVANTSKGTANMSGSGFSGKLLVDYELFKQIWYRGTFGIEQFNVTGGDLCGTSNTGTCDAKLTYASLDFVIRYVFTTGTIRPFLGAGLGLLFPATKSSTALAESSVGTTNVLELLGGVDWTVAPDMYVPISLEYGMLPKSDQVRASWIAFRAGIALAF